MRPMGHKTDRTNKTKRHGGYRRLKSYQTSTIIYDMVVVFCRLYIKSFRQKEQMEQAARSGRQNIAEGSQVSVTSKKSELKLVGVARASLEELLCDFEDFLRQSGLKLWEKDSPDARTIRTLAYRSNRSYKTYQAFLTDSETAANAIICLIHQANFLLDRQLSSLEKSFVEEGGYTEKLYRERSEHRARQDL